MARVSCDLSEPISAERSDDSNMWSREQFATRLRRRNTQLLPTLMDRTPGFRVFSQEKQRCGTDAPRQIPKTRDSTAAPPIWGGILESLAPGGKMNLTKLFGPVFGDRRAQVPQQRLVEGDVVPR